MNVKQRLYHFKAYRGVLLLIPLYQIYDRSLSKVLFRKKKLSADRQVNVDDDIT